jgi:selenocysteine-specific elongation factor
VPAATGVARVALNLRGLPRDAVTRGDVLCTPGAWTAGATIDVRLHGTRRPPPVADALPTQLQLHLGAAAVPVRVRPLGPHTARLRLARPLPLRIGDRMVLRDPGRREVAAGATALDVAPPPLRRRGAAAGRAAELAGMGPTPDAAAELARRRLARRVDLAAMGVPAAQLDTLIAAGVPTAGGWLLDPGYAATVIDRLRDAVAAHDAADPLAPGLPVQAARRAVDLPDARLVDALLRHAVEPGLRLRDGRVVRSVAAALPADLQTAMAQLRAELERAPFAAPEASRLAELGLGPRQQATLVRAGQLMRITDGVLLLPGADARALAVLAGLGPTFTLSAARQALGTTRRVAVPLLELLARTGRTARTPDGQHHVLS